VIEKTETPGAALVVVFCAESECVESAAAANFIRDLRRRRGVAYAVFELLGEDPKVAGEIVKILVAEGLIEPSVHGQLSEAASGGNVVLSASGASVRVALQLGHAINVGLYLLHNPALASEADADATLDAQPSLAKSYAFVFGGPEKDKAVHYSRATLPSSLYVTLWLSDESEVTPYVKWEPKGNEEFAMRVAGANLYAHSKNCCLVSALDRDVHWFHASAHVMDVYVKLTSPALSPSRLRYGAALEGIMAAMINSLERAFEEVSDSTGYY
jgi:hypothetical protein